MIDHFLTCYVLLRRIWGLDIFTIKQSLCDLCLYSTVYAFKFFLGGEETGVYQKAAKPSSFNMRKLILMFYRTVKGIRKDRALYVKNLLKLYSSYSFAQIFILVRACWHVCAFFVFRIYGIVIFVNYLKLQPLKKIILFVFIKNVCKTILRKDFIKN